MPTIVLQFAFLTAGLSVLMAVPVLTALSRGDRAGFSVFLATLVLVAAISLALITALRGTTAPVRRYHALSLAVLAWPLLGLIAALPIWFLSELTFGEAAFEAVSAVTTTGFTLVANLEALPVSVHLWRGALQWYGGLLTLLAVTQILAPLAVGGLPQRQLSFIDDSGQYQADPAGDAGAADHDRLFGNDTGLSALAPVIIRFAA